MLITSLDYSSYVGRIAVGRIHRGTLREGMDVSLVKRDGKAIKSLTMREAELRTRLEDILLMGGEDYSSIIVEIRAGTGGDESALFAGDLYRMYERYAQKRGWQVERTTPLAQQEFMLEPYVGRGMGLFVQFGVEGGLGF